MTTGGVRALCITPIQTDMNTDIPSGVFTPGFSNSSGKNCAYWHYDGFGQLLESNDPDKGVEEFGYNAFGDVTSATDSLGRETTMSYDSLGRLSTKTLPDNERHGYIRI